MNSKSIAIGLVGGAGLFMLWKMKGAGTKTPLGIPKASNSPGSRPRVDNQSQPWYVGPIGWATSKAQDYQKNPNVAQSDLTSVVKSLSDVWGTVSGTLGGGAAQTVPSPDDTNDMSDDTSKNEDADLDNALSANQEQQSNIIGNLMGNYYLDNPETTIVTSESGDIGSSIDNSESDGGMGSDNYDVA